MSITRWMLALMVLCTLLSACRGPVPTVQAELVDNQLFVRATPASSIASVVLITSMGQSLQQWNDLPPNPPPLTIDLRDAEFERFADRRLRVVVRFDDGRRVVTDVHVTQAPPGPTLPVEVTLSVLGSSTKLHLEHEQALELHVPAGTSQLILEASLTGDEAGTVEFDAFPQEFGTGLSPYGHWEAALTPANPRATKVFDADFHSPRRDHVQVFFRRAGNHELLARSTLHVELVDPAVIAQFIEAGTLEFPAPQPGSPSQLNRATITIPNELWNRVASFLGLPQQRIWAGIPVDEALLMVENGLPGDASLALTASVYPIGGTVPSSAFAPEGWLPENGSPQVSRLVNLTPGWAGVRIPVYARPDIEPGTYELRVSGAILGSGKPIFERTLPIQVLATSATTSATLLAAFLIALITLVVFALNYRRLMDAATPRELMLIALIAALWVGGGVVLRLINVGLSVLLGPFNVFIGEFGTEIWTHVCLMVLLTLRPKPGTFALAYGTHFILAGLLAGELQPVGLLIAGSTIGLTEAVCYLAGITSNARLLDRFPRHPVLVMLVAGVALGLADAAATGIQLAIAMGFYRLMYADWYVVAMIAVTGFTYSAIGVCVGLPLAVELRKIDA